MVIVYCSSVDCSWFAVGASHIGGCGKCNSNVQCTIVSEDFLEVNEEKLRSTNIKEILNAVDKAD